MHFLKKNNRLAVAIFTVALFPLSFFYLDKLGYAGCFYQARRFKVPSHFLSDVLAGAVFGLLLGKLTTNHFTSLINRQKIAQHLK